LSAATNDTTALEAQRKKNEAELADLTRTSNEKYNQMLLEQLKLQEDLRHDLNTQMEIERAQLTDSLKAEMTTEIGKTRAQMAGDKEAALMALRRELENKLDVQKTEFESQVDRMSADLLSQAADTR
jgi:hypothetical protein